MVIWSFCEADWLCINPSWGYVHGSLPTRTGLCAAAPRADGERVPLTIDSSGRGAQSTRLIPSVNRGFSWASVTYPCQTTWVSVIAFPDFIIERRRRAEDFSRGFVLNGCLLLSLVLRKKFAPCRTLPSQNPPAEQNTSELQRR